MKRFENIRQTGRYLIAHARLIWTSNFIRSKTEITFSLAANKFHALYTLDEWALPSNQASLSLNH